MLILQFLAIYAIVYAIKDTAGPFDCFSRMRQKLLANKYLGVFFYGLFSCPFCLGFHGGYIVYLLTTDWISWQWFIIWGLSGATFSLFMEALLNYLWNANSSAFSHEQEQDILSFHPIANDNDDPNNAM